MRVFLTSVALAIVVTLADTSVTPWAPILAHIPLIGIVTTALIVVQPRSASSVWFAIVASLVVDALVGAPIGVRSALFLAAFLALHPLIRSFRLAPRASIVLIIGMVLAFADIVGAVFLARAFVPAYQWSGLLSTWWWAAVMNVVIGYLAFHFASSLRARPCVRIRSH